MNLLLDTDIGTDVDDVLALALIVGSPELRLEAITTVYGDTRLRAQLTRRYLSFTAADDKLPIAAGASATMSGREVWWAGHEGALFDGLDQEAIADDGVDLLCRTVAAHAGQIDVLAIGPLTNIALALDQDPAFEAGIRRLIIMGGDFRDDRIPEHNFKSDIRAAQRVFDSNLEIVVGGLDLTLTVRLGSDDVQQLEQGGALGDVLGQEIRNWWQFNNELWNSPHDPILALWMVRPDLFTSSRTRVTVDDEGKTWATADENGKVLVLSAPRPDEIASELVKRITAAGSSVVAM